MSCKKFRGEQALRVIRGHTRVKIQLTCFSEGLELYSSFPKNSHIFQRSPGQAALSPTEQVLMAAFRESWQSQIPWLYILPLPSPSSVTLGR